VNPLTIVAYNYENRRCFTLTNSFPQGEREVFAKKIVRNHTHIVTDTTYCLQTDAAEPCYELARDTSMKFLKKRVKINRRGELRGRLDSGLDFEVPLSLQQIACFFFFIGTTAPVGLGLPP
jgi:hypothetical protein